MDSRLRGNDEELLRLCGHFSFNRRCRFSLNHRVSEHRFGHRFSRRANINAA